MFVRKIMLDKKDKNKDQNYDLTLIETNVFNKLTAAHVLSFLNQFRDERKSIKILNLVDKYEKEIAIMPVSKSDKVKNKLNFLADQGYAIDFVTFNNKINEIKSEKNGEEQDLAILEIIGQLFDEINELNINYNSNQQGNIY